MKSFLIACCLLIASASSKPIVRVSGPIHPVIGHGLVATAKGFRPLALEGFSEDVNQDGFVDPIGFPLLHPIHPVTRVVALEPKLDLPAAVRPEDVATPSIYSPYYVHPYHYGYPPIWVCLSNSCES
nr:uncharacterized protein LOC121118541 [Lepeophtheirus salmonis]